MKTSVGALVAVVLVLLVPGIAEAGAHEDASRIGKAMTVARTYGAVQNVIQKAQKAKGYAAASRIVRAELPPLLQRAGNTYPGALGRLETMPLTTSGGTAVRPILLKSLRGQYQALQRLYRGMAQDRVWDALIRFIDDHNLRAATASRALSKLLPSLSVSELVEVNTIMRALPGNL